MGTESEVGEANDSPSAAPRADSSNSLIPGNAS
jgi:hypothetical protein